MPAAAGFLAEGRWRAASFQKDRLLLGHFLANGLLRRREEGAGDETSHDLAPAMGASQNSQSCPSAHPPTKSAGPVLRAGFTEVFVTGIEMR